MVPQTPRMTLAIMLGVYRTNFAPLSTESAASSRAMPKTKADLCWKRSICCSPMAQINFANRRQSQLLSLSLLSLIISVLMNTRPLDALASFPLLPIVNTKYLVRISERFIDFQLVNLRQASSVLAVGMSSSLSTFQMCQVLLSENWYRCIR